MKIILINILTLSFIIISKIVLLIPVMFIYGLQFLFLGIEDTLEFILIEEDFRIMGN